MFLFQKIEICRKQVMIWGLALSVAATATVGRTGKETVGASHATAAGTAATESYPANASSSDGGQEESCSPIAAVSVAATTADATVADHTEAVSPTTGYWNAAHGSGAGPGTGSGSGSSSSASTRRR